MTTSAAPPNSAQAAGQGGGGRAEGRGDGPGGTRRLIVELAPGQRAVVAEAKLQLTGFRDGVDGYRTCQRAVDTLDSRGHRTRAERAIGSR